jgi:hypothetical protein
MKIREQIEWYLKENYSGIQFPDYNQYHCWEIEEKRNHTIYSTYPEVKKLFTSLTCNKSFIWVGPKGSMFKTNSMMFKKQKNLKFETLIKSEINKPKLLFI